MGVILYYNLQNTLNLPVKMYIMYYANNCVIHYNSRGEKMAEKFRISNNEYLKRDVVGYFHQYYTGYGKPGNPSFINMLKNTFDDYSTVNLKTAMTSVMNILMYDIPEIIVNEKVSNCICVCVPRAKSLSYYTESQLLFKKAVKTAIINIPGVIDGTDCITRIIDTRTTHIKKSISKPNNGSEPYPGITIDTCRIDRKGIENQSIILIDDIYTKNVNIDEDCIQALFNNGARNVIFYTIGYTRR